jgi:hypothetical protein
VEVGGRGGQVGCGILRLKSRASRDWQDTAEVRRSATKWDKVEQSGTKWDKVGQGGTKWNPRILGIIGDESG